VKDAFLAALTGDDLKALERLLTGAGTDDASACDAAAEYAGDNHASVQSCDRASGPPGYTVSVITQGTVGRSVIDGTENKYATATATAVVEPRCSLGDKGKGGKTVQFTCDGNPLTIDPTADDFRLDLSDFYSVHLTK